MGAEHNPKAFRDVKEIAQASLLREDCQ